jgi:pantothenate kinase
LKEVLIQIENQDMVQVISMDAYHRTNAELEATNMKAYKGSAPTFDAQTFASDLARLKDPSTKDSILKFPVYDRQVHDPVPDRVVVNPSHRIILVEGWEILLIWLHVKHICHWIFVISRLIYVPFGYLGLFLLDPNDGFERIADLLDLRIALTVDMNLCLQRVVDRKMRSGRTEQQALEHFDRVDGPNCNRIMSPQTLERADIVVHVNEAQLLSPLSINPSLRIDP